MCLTIFFSLQQRDSTWQTPVHLRWSPSWTGGCWDHLCVVIGPRQVWGGCGTGQWSRLSYSPEVHGRAYTQPAFSTHRPITEHHRPPIQRSAGPWTCPLVPRCAHLDYTHISFLHLSSVLCQVDVIQYILLIIYECFKWLFLISKFVLHYISMC